MLSQTIFLIFGHVAHKIELNWWHIKKTFKLACEPAFFFDRPKISASEGKIKKKMCHMSANTYQVVFYHFRYQSVVSNKIFDFRTCGTQNWAQFVTIENFWKKRSNRLVNPPFFSIDPKFLHPKGKLKKKCATCPQILTKRDFIILGIKVLSQIKFLIFGHVAHKIELNWWHIKKTFKSACKTKQKWKKKHFFENLKISKKLFLYVKKINIFSKFTLFLRFDRYYWCL